MNHHFPEIGMTVTTAQATAQVVAEGDDYETSWDKTDERCPAIFRKALDLPFKLSSANCPQAIEFNGQLFVDPLSTFPPVKDPKGRMVPAIYRGRPKRTWREPIDFPL